MSTTSTRRYDSTRRRANADATRRDIVEAAADLFTEHGWAGTSMKEVATRAGVSVETIYTSIGGKNELLKVALDVAIVGDDEPVPLAQRPEFAAIATGDLAERAAATGRLLLGINARTAALFRALTHAAAGDAALADLLRTSIVNQRESNRQGLLAVARRTPTEAEVDACTALLGTEVYLLLTRDCGWDGEAYASWLGTSIISMFDLKEG